MNYYLPTTIKLLEQYVQLQNVGLRGENIENGMKRIEDLLDKVIVAFQKQLDSLFGAEALDISTDITVLENMMAREGLVEDMIHRSQQTAPAAQEEKPAAAAEQPAAEVTEEVVDEVTDELSDNAVELPGGIRLER